MRVSDREVNEVLRDQLVQILVQLVVDLKNLEEAGTFLKDFLTPVELQVLTKRLAIAYWLRKNRGYENIKENLKVSTATIATVKSMMEKEGLKLALKKIEAEEWANQWAEKIKKFVK